MDRPGVVVLDAGGGPGLPLVDGEGSATAVVWPGSGAQLRSLTVIDLGAGSATVRMAHPGEAVYYVESGGGEIDADGRTGRLEQGSMIHIDGGTDYGFAAGQNGMKLVGGPSPADPALYEGIEASG